MHYLLFYAVVDDYVNRRARYRAAHIALARQAVARGELVLGGAFADPPDGAVLVFRGASPDVAESFARHDPYVMNGLVTKWHVREWTTVVGPNAEAPLPDTL
ncbi:MAG: YciI-like protein [Vicinamibacterales bacterium]